MKKDIKHLLITASKRHGKDSFCKALQKINYQHDFVRFAFADELKRDLVQLSMNMFCKTVDQLDNKQKEIFRPILIAYGCAWREIDPLHWVKIVDRLIDIKFFNHPTGTNFVPIIVDCRFVNEIEYFKNKYPGEVFVLELIRENGPEPTEEEKKNIPLVKLLVDKTILIPDFEPQNFESEMAKIALEFYKQHFI